MKYVMTGVNLAKISSSDKGINTQVLKSALECHTIMSYFSMRDGENSLSGFTPEDLDAELSKTAGKKPLIIRTNNYVWSIIKV